MERAINNGSISTRYATEDILDVGVGLEVGDLSGIQSKLSKAMKQVSARSYSAANIDLVGLIEVRIDLGLGAAGGNRLRGDRLHPKTGEKNDKRK